MNAPVSDAIEALQRSLTTLQSTMLRSDLISSQAVLRTIRASSALENAQVAWGRFLNLPGHSSSSTSDDDDNAPRVKRRGVDEDEGGSVQVERPASRKGKFYTHQELWGRGMARWSDAVMQWEETRARERLGLVGRVFVG